MLDKGETLMTDFLSGFILSLLVGSFGVFLVLALAYVSARADADELGRAH